MGEPAKPNAPEWDDDPLSIVTTESSARRFKLTVRILLIPAAIWLVWSLIEYLTHGGIMFSVADPHGFVSLTFASITFFTLLALELTRPLERPDGARIHRRFGLVSALTALMCLTGVVLAWIIVYSQGAEQGAIGRVVTTPAQTQEFLAGHLPAAGAGYTRIPTGVFIQSVEFKGTSNVEMSGYVWQRLPVGAKAKPGVVFPEANDAYVAKDRPVFERTEGGERLVGWYFNTEFRQLFDYRSYPLDKQNVWLRMWCADFNNNVILTPDFASYPPWRIRNMTAMDEQMVYGEWNPDFTAYSYANNHYSSTFGYGAATKATGTVFGKPDLYFNLGLKRDPQGPLYGQLIRWLFIALIVFAALFLITIDEERRVLVGFTTFEVMSFAVGMLLVIVFDQNEVRQATGARGVVYLEYFSYALYLMILLAGLNAILLTVKVRIRMLTWGGNLLPKLLYWPGYLGLVLVATLFAFF